MYNNNNSNNNNIDNNNNSSDNQIILPTLNIYIQRIIIDKLLNHDKYNNLNHQFNSRTLINLSLVSRLYFKIIMNLNKSIVIDAMVKIDSSKSYQYYSKDYRFNSVEEFNSRFITNLSSLKYSLYNFNNINELNIHLGSFRIIKIETLINFLKLFEMGNGISSGGDNNGSGMDIGSSSGIRTNDNVGSGIDIKSSTCLSLYKLDIVKINCRLSTDDSITLKLVYKIINYLETVKPTIEIHILLMDGSYNIEYNDIFKKEILEKYSLEQFKCIKSSKYKTHQWLNDELIYFTSIRDTLKYWCIDSISTDYLYTPFRTHYNLSFLFEDFKLKNYDIHELSYLPSLIHTLKTNENLESLNVYIDYSIQSEGHSTHICNLDSDYGFIIEENNSHQQWIEFCNAISTNKTLKHLILNNGCYYEGFDNSQDINNQVQLNSNEDEIMKLERLNWFIFIFKNNNTLQTIGFKYFDEQIVNNSLKEILKSNNSIESIVLYPKNKDSSSKYSKETLDILCDIIKTKINFRQLRIDTLTFNETLIQKSNISNLCNQYNIKLEIKQLK